MNESGKKSPEIKSFYETYKITSFSMTIGMIYPNPATDKYRLIAIPIGLLSGSPLIVLMIADIVKLWKNGEMFVILRHIAMGLPFAAGFMKMVFMYYRRKEGKAILDIIDRDHAHYNNLPESYKTLVFDSIRRTHVYILTWVTSVIGIFVAFIGTATVLNIFSQLFMSEPKRYMIYDMNVPGGEPEDRFESPFFEIMFIYTIYVGLLFATNFMGYDGLMIASIDHARLRLRILVKGVEQATRLTGAALHDKMAAAVREQVETLRLIQLIQRTYNVYLGFMYVAVFIEMVICLYLMNEGYSFDFQFTCISMGTVLHIYLPCLIAQNLKTSCEETATHLYCCGWERLYDVRARKCLALMVARAQRPVLLEALGTFAFEMDLFVRTSKTAYSIYTLLKTS